MIMTAPRSNNPHSNNPMFRRLIRRLIFANRGRLFVILLALTAGATVSAALLNLQTDAKRRINSEFRSFGANVAIWPKNVKIATQSKTFASSILDKIQPRYGSIEISKVGLLYLVANVDVLDENLKSKGPAKTLPAVLVGYDYQWTTVEKIIPSRTVSESKLAFIDIEECQLGENVASTLGVSLMQVIEFRSEAGSGFCSVSGIRSFGGSEDNQIFVPLAYLQYQTGNMDRLSTVSLNVSGNPAQINDFVATLSQQLPEVEVRPLRQFTEAQTRIYSRISGLLTAATGIILTLTVLCVMAAMTNIAAERKNDVGMMKAIGGSARSILNLFLTEAALLGLAGGLIGAAAGIALSIVLGKAVFGVAAAPRLIVYPISVAFTVIVAILGAYPLRRLANVRPATIFRGEA
jgi:putative ABC transport system permease protein